MCVLQTSTHLTNKLINQCGSWCVCDSVVGICELHICSQTVSHFQILKWAWLTNEADLLQDYRYVLYRDCRYCATWFRHALAICTMIEVNFQCADPS